MSSRCPSRYVLLCLLGAVLTSGSGCATVPKDPVERALYADLRQIVDTEQRIGWVIDEAEVRESAPAAMQSTCQVDPKHSTGLGRFLDARIEAEGGPAEEAYELNGGDKGAIHELLTLERMRLVLDHAVEKGEKGCPFWLETDAEFAGVQTDANRFLLMAESFGGLSLLRRNDEWLIGAGGAFRIMPAYGFNQRLTIATGIELGGNGALSQGENGEQSLSARPVGGLPLLFRVHDDTWLYDFEFALLTQYHDSTVALPPGFRLAAGLGIGSVRVAGIMPAALAFVAYEMFPRFRELPQVHAFRIGTRVGLNYDP